jgi:hypothetical protein
MRENRLSGSEGGVGESRFLPLSKFAINPSGSPTFGVGSFVARHGR